ncbi:MAG: ribonuclease Y [Massiliimalia sp.]|jgi:ribonuclease Y
MPIPMIVLLCVVVAVVAAGIAGTVCFKAGIAHRQKTAETEIGSAEAEAQRIVEAAEKEAETKRKEAIISAKDEIHKLRSDAEKDIKDRRSEISRQERRIVQKEENLDRKTDNLEKKEEKLNEKLKLADQKLEEAEIIKRSQIENLERISGLTAEEAKAQLLSSLEDDLAYEKAQRITNYEQQLKSECDEKARQIISLAISRCAAEHVSEATVSVVPLPNDEMKGRIIGREGRNIRAIETLTGVDLIIDDTPEAITLSCFDPVRRELARMTLERLISDGRIHPSRIEETVEKCRREMEVKMKQEGERAILETNVHGVHYEIVKLLGRLTYRTSYCQNVLDHSIEVAHLAGIMASELGIDAAMARRAGLLHDIGKALNHEIEGSHVEIGVDVCRKFKEPGAVLHAIEAHHNDVEPRTVLACLIQAADAISAARPAARRENLESFIKRLEKLEEIANSFNGVEKSFAIQAGREIRIIIKPEVVKDDKMVLVARDIAKRIENELNYPGQIKVNLIRESRAVDFAK